MKENYIMNLSSKTVSVLKNFADINENILFKPGKTLSTISNQKNVLAEAQVDETFDQEFGIYKLPDFIRCLELFDKADLQFNGGQSLTIKDSAGKAKLKYMFADKSVLTSPTKTIELPDKEVTLSLKKDVFDKLMRVAVTLNLPDISIEGNGKTIEFICLDKKDSSTNDYKMEIGTTNKVFKAYFKKENFKLIPGDYDVAISKQKISHFINRSMPIQYWIAVEPDSEF